MVVQSINSPIDMTPQMRENNKPVFQNLKSTSLISRNESKDFISLEISKQRGSSINLNHSKVFSSEKMRQRRQKLENIYFYQY